MIPPGLFSTIRDRFVSILDTRDAHQVTRT